MTIAGVTKAESAREGKHTAAKDPVKGKSAPVDGLWITITLNPPAGVKGTAGFRIMAGCAAAKRVSITE